jgi:hypothetical protein
MAVCFLLLDLMSFVLLCDAEDTQSSIAVLSEVTLIQQLIPAYTSEK